MTGDDDYWVFFTTYHPTARKEHRCGECGRAIVKGERYWTMGGLNDDRTFVWHKMCEHCEVASGWLMVVCDGYLFGMTREDLRNHVDGDESYLRSRPLTRLARWWAAGWRNRAGELRPVYDVMTVTDEAIEAYRKRYRAAVPA